MGHEEEFCEAINQLILAYLNSLPRYSIEPNFGTVEQARAELLRVVKNEAEKDG